MLNVADAAAIVLVFKAFQPQATISQEATNLYLQFVKALQQHEDEQLLRELCRASEGISPSNALRDTCNGSGIVPKLTTSFQNSRKL